MKCPYCDVIKKNAPGLSMHIRHMHPDKWNKTLKDSVPAGYNLLTASTKLKKGDKKPKIRQDCPFCSYKSDHPPGLAKHIQCTHPLKWRGNLGSSLGRAPSRKWKKDSQSVKNRKKERSAAWRAKNIARGLTSQGAPRKQNLRKSYLERHGYDAIGELLAQKGIEDMKPIKPIRKITQRRIAPIVYRRDLADIYRDERPRRENNITSDSSLREEIINRVAEKIAEKLLE